MKVYLEFIFIVNYLLDYMILYGTKRILKINTSIIRIYISSIIGSLSTFLLFININNTSLFLLKIIISSIMILISFKKNNFLRNIFYLCRVFELNSLTSCKSLLPTYSRSSRSTTPCASTVNCQSLKSSSAMPKTISDN